MSKKAYFFFNPHSNHSYFTLLSLSRLGPVEFLCPPLTIQLFLRQWSMAGLRLKYSVVGCFLAQPISLIAYTFYVFGLISEQKYLSWLRVAAQTLLFFSRNHQVVIYTYQDYFLDIIKSSQSLSHSFATELIIQIPIDQPNHNASLDSARNSRLVISPTKIIQHELLRENIHCHIVPYGGDKHRYRTESNYTNYLLPRTKRSKSFSFNATDIVIAARSNNYRKGLDLLLIALHSLLARPNLASLPTIRIIICGSVTTQSHLKSLFNLSQDFSRTGSIFLEWGQLSQDSYLSLLRRASLFVMPSRLEGSSYAALEALCLGVPALLSPQCGVEVFKNDEHGLLLDLFSTKSIELAIMKALENPNLLKLWRENLLRDRGLFTWNAYLEGVANSVMSL